MSETDRLINPEYQKAVADYYEDNLNNFEMVQRNQRANAATLSMRPEFNKQDYYDQRPGSRIPTQINDIMKDCEDWYLRCGILRSVCDLTSEFVVDGFQIMHTDPEIQKFYTTWSRKVDLEDRAERFVAHLTKSGNAVVRRYTTQINVKVRNKMMDGDVFANAAKIGSNSFPNFRKAEIPVKYTFYKPSQIELVGGEAGALSDSKVYGLRIPAETITKFYQAGTPLEKRVLQGIPVEILESAKKNTTSYILYSLPAKGIYVGHYKKDDSDIWAYPLIYAGLLDLKLNENIKLAKTFALEGFYNLVRIWKLGDHKEGILPPKNAAVKLHEVLQQHTGGGAGDIIWDSMIDVQELYPPIEKLNEMKEDKNPILILFGIPEEIAGGVNDKTGSSNAGIKVKNYAKKLAGLRRELMKWLNAEIALVHRNMGFDGDPPVVRFKNDDLTDDAVYFDLLRELCDRGVLSDDTMLERIEENPEIEKHRIKQQNKDIESGSRPEKASPFHNPTLPLQQEHELKKIKLDSQLGSDDKGGRPNGAKDSKKRTRKVRASFSRASMVIGANEIYDSIESGCTKLALNKYNAKDIRSLTGEQKAELEKSINFLFANTSPDQSAEGRYEFSQASVKDTVEASQELDCIESFTSIYNDKVAELGRDKMSNAVKRTLKIEAYTDLWSQ